MIKKIKISKDFEDVRLDKWLKKQFRLTQSFIEKELRKGLIKVNNKKIKAGQKVLFGDIIYIENFSEKIFANTRVKKIPKNISGELINKFKSSIIYENKDFIIINKWNGIATQGGSKINISINEIIKFISDEYNLVHRLDKDTSGLLIISKNYKSSKIFGKMFKEQQIEKNYLAICQGIPKNFDSNLKLKIIDKKNPNKSSYSYTKYKVLINKNRKSIILFTPMTGKTHQLRIVSKKLGCPIVGDIKYNAKIKSTKEKLKLNASKLKFNFKSKDYIFTSNLPIHFSNYIKNNGIKFNVKTFQDY